ncbi:MULTISPECIES: hypothetical protein [Escherichia]|uniref:hypothetical protein n=1 Tax=Escherichia TaxID=561 RepID=UPI00032F4307|nr:MULTISPECIES: hypothetical protein [Escherichia]EOQ57324.1 hypothetical protein WEW_01940 [Escherichia coli KTE33]EOU83314.1 hypothetical protein WES_01288 [Escherichia sp. KTE31]
MRPDGHPWGYRCGDEDSDRYVPDELFGVNFLQACRNHDKCYEAFGSVKSVCDDNLGSDIKLACNEQLKGFGKVILPVCELSGSGYSWVVRTFGEGAFKAAQGNNKELEMLDFLEFGLGMNVDPVYHNEAYEKVITAN